MPAEIHDLETIISYGLCAGCGLCESLAGVARIEMGLSSAGHMRPRIKAPLEGAVMARILAVCPGVTVTGPDADIAGSDAVFHDIWGPIRSLHRGWSADEELRFHSAAGGAMTALGCYLLETGKVDAVAHVRAASQRPMETDTIVSRTAADVRSGAQSRYGPAAPLRHVTQLLDEGLVFAVLAKPCDVAAIRNLERIDPRVALQIPYLISIFCGGVPTIHTPDKIAAYHGLAPEEVSVFRWRGNGWPGPTHIETKDGRVFDLTYDKVWYSDDVPWTYDMQFRCKICPDAIGELADVACPDAWVMRDGKPIHEEAPGANLFIARTKRGEDMVAEAAAAGALHLEPFTLAELDAMHDDHVPRKLENPARLRALARQGAPTPCFANFREAAMIARAGTARDYAAEDGTRRRIRAGKHREPLS
jgi:coenzyme F420 hydrogenase subunit beta